jgi:TPR repeat protein
VALIRLSPSFEALNRPVALARVRSGQSLLAAIRLTIALFPLLFAIPAAMAQTRGLDPIQQTQTGGTAGNYYALVIGIDNYQSPLATLKTAVGDAKAVGNLLHDRYGFKVVYLLDQNATRFNILDALSKYRNTLGENDSLLIYYAGHGVSDREAQKAYWLPVDADSGTSPNRIIADDLTTGVRVLPSRHVLIVSDSCYSGALTRDANTPVPSDGQAAFLNRMLRSRSRTLMASGGDEPVSDSGSNGHSVFAYAVLRALETADQPMFTASDLFYGYVRQQVAGRSEQLPQYSIIRNSDHDEGDFVFARLVAPAPPAPAFAPASVASNPRGASAPPSSPRNASSSSDATVDTSAMSPAFAFGRGDDLVKQHRYGDAAPLLHFACEGGVAAACTTLGLLYRNGFGIARDDREAVALFRKACDGGNMHGCSDLGLMHENGIGVGKDEQEAVELYSKACEGSEPLGCENLANMYENGKGVGMDSRQAASFYRKACEGGLASGCTSLGLAYASGKGIAKDLSQAATLLRKACDGADAQGCFYIGNMYLAGMGLAKDAVQAATFIQKSCDAGYAAACDALGRFYQEGSALPKDDVRALALFKKSCDAGNPSGCTNLGVAYGRGLGIARNDTEAAALYRKGCDGGNVDGCNYLAVLYFNGSGVSKDAAQSALLARKACDGGIARGCSNLGLLYESGTGVAKDLHQAEELFHKACEGGYDEGCKNLKRLKP